MYGAQFVKAAPTLLAVEGEDPPNLHFKVGTLAWGGWALALRALCCVCLWCTGRLFMCRPPLYVSHDTTTTICHHHHHMSPPLTHPPTHHHHTKKKQERGYLFLASAKGEATMRKNRGTQRSVLPFHTHARSLRTHHVCGL